MESHLSKYSYLLSQSLHFFLINGKVMVQSQTVSVKLPCLITKMERRGNKYSLDIILNRILRSGSCAVKLITIFQQLKPSLARLAAIIVVVTLFSNMCHREMHFIEKSPSRYDENSIFQK